VSRQVETRKGQKKALQIIHGDEASQFNQLWYYGQELRRSDWCSKFFPTHNQVKVGDQIENHLATLYCSYDVLNRGFLRACRPLICDVCHFKTRYPFIFEKFKWSALVLGSGFWPPWVVIWTLRTLLRGQSLVTSWRNAIYMVYFNFLVC
jgi:hypothetical protein